MVLESIESPNLPPDIPVVKYTTLDMTPVVESKRKANRAARRKMLREALEPDDEDIFLML